MAQRQLYSRVAAEHKPADAAVDNLLKEPLKDAPVPEEAPAHPEEPSRKRRRNQVDYRELYEQMKKEGFAS